MEIAILICAQIYLLIENESADGAYLLYHLYA